MSNFLTECRKAKRRGDVLICLLAPLTILLWCGGTGPETDAGRAQGYGELLYNIPLLNTVVMPVAMAMLASRLWNAEEKGGALKLLYTMQSRRSLFLCKAGLGFLQVLSVSALETCCILLLGRVQLFYGVPPAAHLAWFFVCTSTVNAMLFFSELMLSVFASGPLVALCVGIVGSLVALFSAFLPKGLGYFLPWGYFYLLSSYVMTDWDKDTRIVTYGTAPFPVPLLLWTALLAATLLFLTWKKIRDKEV